MDIDRKYYIQYSAKGADIWITYQMAYDSFGDAMDVFYAAYEDDKLFDYRVVDERFVKVMPNGVVISAD